MLLGIGFIIMRTVRLVYTILDNEDFGDNNHEKFYDAFVFRFIVRPIYDFILGVSLLKLFHYQFEKL